MDPSSKLYNPEHDHLADATIGFLWAGVENKRKGRQIIGQCEMGLPPLGKWARGRMELQLAQWFGTVPDFLITIDAGYADTCSDAEFCALVEHELLHAGQDKDIFGSLAFKKDGTPKFALRAHDVEEFVSIVARYGSKAAHVEAMVDAAKKRPQIAQVDIAAACGTCFLRVG